ncbi:ATP-binding protein [Corynebacterium aquatimens]|uniref:ATP-dependent DNA helicase RecG n=1 Tax=Corynebacterium aquatimens TaxID=1190508 RepID=A0A931GXW4_9CORY|nr:ATP-binding protein [Corynebacterium aquatimens]MBG6122639.1 ATP-dependent DNA helicase RecG [Corynebacterium aquatimens]
MTAFLRLGPLIDTNASREVATISLSNGQEVIIPAFPESAVDEVIANAAAHRDWDATSPIVVEQSPTELKVWSPGSLPVGVTVDNVLTIPSVPRNPTLMTALRMLGLAEQASRGFDRMWASMLSTGRTPPTVNASENFVEVSLSSGNVDRDFVIGLANLREVYGHELFDSVNGLVIARHLMHNPILTASTAAHLMQLSLDQAEDVLAFYANAGFIEQLRDAPEWILSETAREEMKPGEEGMIATVTIQEWIETQLREGKSLSSREVAEELGVDRTDITRILSHLRDLGRAKIDPSGKSRGPSVRWIGI